MSRVFKALTHPKLILHYLFGKMAPYIYNDKLYVKWKFRLNMGCRCNLEHPKTFQEKLQWIKFNDRKPIYHQMVDKVEVKKFIAERVGEEYVIPTLGVWDHFEDIDFDTLPDEFIMKNTYDSGTYCICTNKLQLSKEAIRKRLSITWGKDYYVFSREWPYKGLKHRIIAEPLLHDEKSPYLTDYKFFTFNGEPKFYYTTSDRGSATGLKEDFFDVNGNLLELNQKGYYNNPNTPSLPVNLEKMVDFARILAKDTYHLRVDFYEINGRMYVGEMTFFDGGGFCPFVPDKYNRILGDWIKLPID